MINLGCKKATMATLVTVLSIILVLSGCSSASNTSNTNSNVNVTAGEAPTEIIVGTVLPLTGKEAKTGRQYEGAFVTATEEINENGGLYIKEYDKKIPIKLVKYDDETDPQLTVELMEKLCNQKDVVAILGGFPTNLVSLQANTAEKYKIPYVNSGGAGRDIYARGYKYVFGTASPVDLMGATVIDFIKSQIDKGVVDKPVKIALAYEDTAHGLDYAVGIKAGVEKYPDDFVIVLDEKFELYSASYSSLLNRLKAAKADAFLVDAHLEDYITMHRQYTEMGLYHSFVSYGARGPQPDAIKALGDAANYIFAGVWWEPTSTKPASQNYYNNYKKFNNSEPGMNSYSYIAAQALYKAIEDAGVLDREKVREALENVKVTDTIIAGGEVSFNKNHQAEYPFTIVQGKPNGVVDIIWPESEKTGEPVAPIPKK